MKFRDAIQRFNQTPFHDAYSGEELGYAQLDVFNDSMREGPTAQRRVLEVSVDQQPPTRRAVTFHDTTWLTGLEQLDAFRGEVVRKKWVLQKAELKPTYYSLRELLEEGNGVDFYAAKIWEKTNAQVEISSAKFNQLVIYSGITEDIQRDYIVKEGNTYYTVMSVYEGATGHLASVVEQLDPDPLETVEMGQKVWDPITETYTGSGEEVTILKLRWQSDFEYHSLNTPTFERGDLQVACLKDQPIETTLELNEGTWRVVNSQQRNNVYYLHLRRTVL